MRKEKVPLGEENKQRLHDWNGGRIKKLNLKYKKMRRQTGEGKQDPVKESW